MPISYTIDPDRGRVVLRFTGTVRDPDLFTTFHELYDDPRHRIGMPELTDCRELERAEFTGAGLRALARMTAAKLDPAHKPWKVAVVAPQAWYTGSPGCTSCCGRVVPSTWKSFETSRRQKDG